MVALPSYANAARLRAATDIPSTPEADIAIVDALQAGARAVERLCRGRRFYPTTETRTFDWPDLAGVNVSSRVLWLDGPDELISVSAMTIDGVAKVEGTDYRLAYKVDQPDGDAYRAIDMLRSTSSRFTTSTNDFQDPISVTGVWGFTNQTATSGALDGAISDTTSTAIQITNGSRVNVGDAIKVDDEYMIVEAATWVDTTENTGGALTVDHTDTTIAVADGTSYATGERLLIDTERMVIVDISGNNLTVRRAVDATDLAAHASGADIYVDRGRTVARGQLGTTAQTHSDAATVTYHVAPAAVRALNLAEALVQLAQESAGYARTIGSGEAEREARGAGLGHLRDDVYRRYAVTSQVYASGSPLV